MPGADEQAPAAVPLKPIDAVSPSLAETLRACPLQAALSRLPKLKQYLLGNPKAWVGIAYHEVLENVLRGAPQENEAAFIGELWKAAIEKLQRRASSHPLDCRFSVPERWAGYHLAAACARMRAKEAIARRFAGSAARGQVEYAGPILERRFSALGGKLIGKPDAVAADVIEDYKSGNIYDDMPEGPAVKAGYVRQLRLYGHLVHEETGRCPAKARLLPMQGEPVEIALDAESCAAEAEVAVGLLDAFNRRLETVQDAAELATPSPAACKWCQYKSICPAFWSCAEPAWAPDLGSAAVKGTLLDNPKLIHNGRALSLSIATSAGTMPAGISSIAPLDRGIHAALEQLSSGAEVRVVNLYTRKDGQAAPTESTVVLESRACPAFSLPRGNSGPARNCENHG